MSKSSDYHDYVFRNGKLVGEFEEMYLNSADTPWAQDQQSDWIDVRLTREFIRDIGKFDQILDLGCGTGHYLNLMAEEHLAPEGSSHGYDISETACRKARTLFPNSTFSVADLSEKSPAIGLRKITEQQNPATLFILRGTLWYVYPRLANVIDNIKNMMATNDRLLIVQNFPPLANDFIGKEVIPNYRALINHFSHSFVLDRHLWYEDRLAAKNDNWFIGLFSVNY